MSVVIVLDGAAPGRFSVAVSPLAELAACLHVLTGSAHHTEHAAWADQVTRTAPPAFRAGLGRFAPLWTALRWRAFYPGLDGPSPVAAPLAGLGIDRFAELTAYACASGYHGFDFSQVCHDPGQAAVLRHAAARLPEPHLGLAEDLLRDPEALRADILRFLDLCGRVFFGGLWAQTAPVLDRAAHLVRRRLADGGPAPALVSLSPSSARLVAPSAGPARVVFDKVHHAVINPARTPLLLIPTRYGAPHLLVKNEPGLPPVVHFPVEAPKVGSEPGAAVPADRAAGHDHRRPGGPADDDPPPGLPPSACPARAGAGADGAPRAARPLRARRRRGRPHRARSGDGPAVLRHPRPLGRPAGTAVVHQLFQREPVRGPHT
ncbi:hypothetical protein FMEAI12_4840028 [Parafrankia sp. Ea1.12]|nr:hypothetical protein FMEAI12_4840028 [Parafrankia sp. Ea1.12]